MQVLHHAASLWYTVYRLRRPFDELLFPRCACRCIHGDKECTCIVVTTPTHTNPHSQRWLFLSSCIRSHDCVFQSHCPGPVLPMSCSQASLIPVWLEALRCYSITVATKLSLWVFCLGVRPEATCVLHVTADKQSDGLTNKNACNCFKAFLVNPHDIISFFFI